MCKANLAVLGGQGICTLQLFDVVAFNQAGERSSIVSAGVTLSGAIACARGFNSGRGALVAVVLPAAIEGDVVSRFLSIEPMPWSQVGMVDGGVSNSIAQ
jgi:hypothetical protein